MPRWVEVSFECLPLRSVGRFDVPPDASDAEKELFRRLRMAVQRHGAHNAFYLCNGRCVFHLTNDEQLGRLEFRFQGTVLTDSEDRHTAGSDLEVELAAEVCDWLTAPVVDWFAQTVSRAVQVEFDRYIEAGDLEKARERIERLQAQTEARGGFIGQGL